MASERWTPAIAAAEERREAMMDTSGQIEQLRKTLAKQKKAELIQAMIELAQNDRTFLRNLQLRFDSLTSLDDLTHSTKQAIVDATRVDENRINYNFNYDSGAYETIQRNLTRLTEQGHYVSAMELAINLMEKGSYQLEMSDEGLMLEEIDDCLNVVIKAVKTSNLPLKQISEWLGELAWVDRVGFVCDPELASIRKQAKRQARKTDAQWDSLLSGL